MKKKPKEPAINKTKEFVKELEEEAKIALIGLNTSKLRPGHKQPRLVFLGDVLLGVLNLLLLIFYLF